MKVIRNDAQWFMTELYIPHGSDESFLRYGIYNKPITLYPTWFRWKSASSGLLFFASLLYIPHGSDESNIWTFTTVDDGDLYIPHGSDERLLDTL